ncbi:hypothetical protein SRHO_G00291350 [Serrasalmus rhombeus]
MPSVPNPKPFQPQPAVERKMEGCKPQIQWPKSCQKKEWEAIDSDLVCLLSNLKRDVERRLERMGELIYSYGRERFGVKDRKAKKEHTPRDKSRRQQEIERLVKERRQLKKQWKKANEVERLGLKALQSDIKQRLATLRRAEHLRRQRRKKERARVSFYKNPFKLTKSLFVQEKSGTLKAPLKDIEEFLKNTYSEADTPSNQRHEPVTVPADMPPLHPPMHEMDTSTPTWNEVVNIVKRARTASAPGPNGIPYRLYKNTPGVLKYLWHQMKLAWIKEIIPRGKFSSALWPKDSTFLLKNEFVDTSIQKAGVGGFSGCLEHASIIWHQLQSSKREKKDLHVVFLDVANAFGSVPHRILWTAFAFFQVPDNIANLIQAYFRDIQFCMTMHESTTAWQQLELGIMAGCTVSPLAFTLAMELIIRASAWVVGGERVDGGLRLPPIRAYMDDMTTITSTKPCTKRLLEKLQSNLSWAGMKIKPCKSMSISVVKGQITNDTFTINDEPMPTILLKQLKVSDAGTMPPSMTQNK